jgi:PAS domain-containing protein
VRPQAESFGDKVTALGLNATLQALGFFGWVALLYLTILCRSRYPSVVFSWVRPVTLAFEVFCVTAALRFAGAFLVLFYPAFDLQNFGLATNVIALCVVVGYASVYYRRIPFFVMRARRHQANSRRFRNIADAATDAFIEIDADSNIWYANPAAAKIFGFFNEAASLMLTSCSVVTSPS